MERSRRLVLAGIAGVVLLAAAWTAAVRGLADAASLEARAVLDATLREKRLPSTEESDQARRALAMARVLEPSNPLFLELLARLDDLQARGAASPAERERALRRALSGFREAARLRPASPFVWTGLAAVKLRLDEMDFEFYGALQRADRYGAWEPAVQLALADIGLASWRLLAQPAKRMVAAAIGRGMGRESKQLRSLAAQHGTLALFCADERRLGTPTGLCAGS